VLWIGTETALDALALEGARVVVPSAGSALEAWRAAESHGVRHGEVAVAAWTDRPTCRALLETPLDAWLEQSEGAIARWAFALAVAVARCSDEGAIVALVERPGPLDCAGFAAESAVADAVLTLVRSLARSEGARRVRVNAVTTPARLAPPRLVAPPPALASYPGRVEREAVGAVRALLAADACGVTGSVVAADCGRSW
jgi:hypothetical protein